MHGISIRYEYDGDEEIWETAIATFIQAIDEDDELSGKFRYRVNKAKEGNTRVHWGWWDTPETVQTLQSRAYFKTFATAVQEFGGATLSPVQLSEHLSTRR